MKYSSFIYITLVLVLFAVANYNFPAKSPDVPQVHRLNHNGDIETILLDTTIPIETFDYNI